MQICSIPPTDGWDPRRSLFDGITTTTAISCWDHYRDYEYYRDYYYYYYYFYYNNNYYYYYYDFDITPPTQTSTTAMTTTNTNADDDNEDDNDYDYGHANDNANDIDIDITGAATTSTTATIMGFRDYVIESKMSSGATSTVFRQPPRLRGWRYAVEIVLLKSRV